MMNILESYDLLGFVIGETKAPPQTIVDGENGSKPNPNFIKWRKIDCLVKGWLTATFSKRTKQHVMVYE